MKKTRPPKNYYEHEGVQCTSNDLIVLAGWGHLPPNERSQMATRMRSALRTRTTKEAIEYMRHANPPKSRNAKNSDISYKYDMSDDFSKWDKDLELERSTEQRLQMGWNEDELIIKARLI